MGLYDRYLGLRLRTAGISPDHVALIITERDLLEQGAYDTLADFLEWAVEYGADRITVYVSVLDAAAVPTLRRELEDLTAPHEMAVRGPDDEAPVDAPIQIGIGHGGKEEFTTAVRALAEDVDAGDLDPDDITEDDVEHRLVFAAEPDLVIKTGAERLSDFMIWQSVYSELYFTDVNWRNFRRRDYLRALLSYGGRSRRFGR